MGEDRRDTAVAAGRVARQADNEGRALRRDLVSRHRPADSFEEVIEAARERHSNVVALRGRATADDNPRTAEAARAASADERPATPSSSAVDQEELDFLRRRNAELAEQEAARQRAELEEEEQLRREAREAIEEANRKGDYR